MSLRACVFLQYAKILAAQGKLETLGEKKTWGQYLTRCSVTVWKSLSALRVCTHEDVRRIGLQFKLLPVGLERFKRNEFPIRIKEILRIHADAAWGCLSTQRSFYSEIHMCRGLSDRVHRHAGHNCAARPADAKEQRGSSPSSQDGNKTDVD